MANLQGKEREWQLRVYCLNKLALKYAPLSMQKQKRGQASVCIWFSVFDNSGSLSHGTHMESPIHMLLKGPYYNYFKVNIHTTISKVSKNIYESKWLKFQLPQHQKWFLFPSNFYSFLHHLMETRIIPWINKFKAALREALGVNIARGRTPLASPIFGTHVPTGIAHIGSWSMGKVSEQCLKYLQIPGNQHPMVSNKPCKTI